MSPARRPRSARAKKELFRTLDPILESKYPSLAISLNWENPYQLIVATLLSAQCTDERVNRVTRDLFPRYPDARALAGADLAELEKAVRPTGFFRNKAKHLQGLGCRVTEAYGGEIPGTMEDLLTLPGVARKTANVVLSNAFGIHEGVVVDTHVKRVSGRLGFTDSSDPKRIERDLMEVFPREAWHPFAWRILVHGRHVCVARKPRCGQCDIAPFCPSEQPAA